MVVQLNKCLAPKATQVTFSDPSCQTELDDSLEIYELSTALDSCSTKLTWDDGKLVFSNYVTVQSWHGNVVTAAAQNLEVVCR